MIQEIYKMTQTVLMGLLIPFLVTSAGAGFIGGLIAVICFAAIIIVIIRSNNRKIAAEYKLG